MIFIALPFACATSRCHRAPPRHFCGFYCEPRIATADPEGRALANNVLRGRPRFSPMVAFLQQSPRKRRSLSDITESLIEKVRSALHSIFTTFVSNAWEGSLLKLLFAAVASVAMVGGAFAADLPRKEPPPVAAPVGKAPIGKLPFGKGPVVARY